MDVREYVAESGNRYLIDVKLGNKIITMLIPDGEIFCGMLPSYVDAYNFIDWIDTNYTNIKERN